MVVTTTSTMLKIISLYTILILLSHSESQPVPHLQKEAWADKYGAQFSGGFIGIPSFAYLPTTKCLENPEELFDIAILGMPFDTAVTYRPGARFGPFGIRSGSRRQGGYTSYWGLDPYKLLKVVDCGDIPISPFDNALAVDQMEVAYDTLLARPIAGGPSPSQGAIEGESVKGSKTGLFAKDGIDHPRIVTLGGDHTIVLPILRSLYKVYGPITVIHFDSHTDTGYNISMPSDQSKIHHGSYFYIAYQEGILSNSSIHAGIKGKGLTPERLEHDASVGFELITADDIDVIGVTGVVEWIRERVGERAVYLSFDIDTIDVGEAPATGTPESGGWTMREAKRILKGLSGINFIGADLVEVAPAYDNADVTSINAADLVHDFMSLMVSDKPYNMTGMRRRNGKVF